jgi:type I restriction enzyme S subunit
MAQNALTRLAHEPSGNAFDGGIERPVLWAPVSSRLLARDARRLEASTYLTDGFGLRQGLEAVDSTVRFSELVAAWMPGRLKGYTVDEGRGLPYFSVGQVFEGQPRVRKWLAEGMLKDPDSLRVDPSWLLVSRSGEVGRVTAVYREHDGKIISDDMVRISPHNAADYGWLYSYMKTPTFIAIARSSQYGHMIKHLEPDHVLGMPVAWPEVEVRSRIGREAEKALETRRQARVLQAQADSLYAAAVNPNKKAVQDAVAATVRASSVFSGRRRMEGQFHRAGVLQVEALVEQAGVKVQPLIDVVKSVTVGARFKRYFGDNGTPYRSASELFDVNPAVTKRVYSAQLPDPEKYLLRSGWIIMACSGQTYGLLGRTTVLTENHDGVFGSHDLIRIIPDPALARTGYLQTALNHVDYGRPRVVRYASGTSVPHLDPQDIRRVAIPRLEAALEAEIADLSDEATRLSAEADRLETSAVQAAEDAISTLTGRHGSLQLVQQDLGNS